MIKIKISKVYVNDTETKDILLLSHKTLWQKQLNFPINLNLIALAYCYA